MPLSSGSDAGVTSIAGIGSGFRGDVAPVTVTARTMTLQISEAAVLGASADGLLESDDPAPSGGITINLSSSDFAILGIQPAAISIKEGSDDGLLLSNAPRRRHRDRYRIHTRILGRDS